MIGYLGELCSTRFEQPDPDEPTLALTRGEGGGKIGRAIDPLT